MNVGSRLNNTLSSSISYSKTFNSVPPSKPFLNRYTLAEHEYGNHQYDIANFQLNIDRMFPLPLQMELKKVL